MESSKQTVWFRLFGLPLARLASWILFTLLGPTLVRGRNNVPNSGGVLVLSNHLADVDPILVQIACKRSVYFMAKSELFEMPLLGRIIKAFKAFPVKRGEPDRGAIKHAVQLLQSGEVVCVFPEGQLSETGDLLELKPGVALLIRLAKVPVVCIGLKNTNRIMPYGKLIPRPALTVVRANWGEPINLEGVEPEEALKRVEAELRRLTA